MNNLLQEDKMDHFYKPIKVSELYYDDVLGKKFLYNPKGYSGVVVVDNKTFNIVMDSNGKNTIECLSKKHRIQENKLFLGIKELKKRGILLSENKTHVQKRKKVFDCWLHLTNTCNLSCSYCYIHKFPGSMSFETAKKTIDKMYESCKLNEYEEIHIRFAGGEPLLKFDIIKNVIEHYKHSDTSIKIKFGIITNGTLMTREIAQYFKDNNVYVSISLDGTEKYHNIYRCYNNGTGSYADTMRGIENALHTGIRPHILTTVASSNLDGLQELTEKMIQMRMNFRFSLQKDLSNTPDLLSRGQDLVNIMSKCLLTMEEASLIYGNCFNFKFNDIKFRAPLKQICSVGHNTFAANYNGNIGLCGINLSTCFSSIDKDTDLMTEVRKYYSECTDILPDSNYECGKCKWRHSCARGCPIQNLNIYGTIYHKSPYCEELKEIIPKLIHYEAVKTFCAIR